VGGMVNDAFTGPRHARLMANDTYRAAMAALLAGDFASAAAGFRERIATLPAETAPRYGLASALAASGDGAAAAATLEEARMLHALLLAGSMGADVPRLSPDGDYAAGIATQLYTAFYPAAASVVFGRAIAAGHLSQAGLLTYGLSLQHQGRAEEAIRAFRAALEVYPGAAIHQFMLYPHFMVADGPARYAAEARAWAERWTPEAENPVFENPPSAGRRLRIGYVSPAFGALQVRQFITPILETHDPQDVAIFLYCATAEAETAWPEHIVVRPIGQLTDAAAAALIRDDGIDVLVDCWGHSAGSRLGVFARRAAPVQAGWINFIQTTGLARMDYVLHSDSMAAPSTAALFTETVLSMGDILAPYRPHPNRPAATPTPALATGQISFGSFNHPAKLSDATVRAWSRILAGRPGARLVLKYRYFIDPVLQAATRARFAAERVDPDRIEFRGQSEGADYLASFAEIDLALDPSPCPGGTTTCDALANGVPVLTLAGPDFYSRIGVQALATSGLPELVADSWDDYVARALALTDDVAALDRLRSRVRPGFEAGAMCDEAGFVRRLEATFRGIFESLREPEAQRGAA
jgi:predicted O-linked N-acetylglucosamine transferase (SPINDLY family)